MISFTHFITDPNPNTARALVFTAEFCEECGEYHRVQGTETGVMQWLLASSQGLQQLHLGAIPDFGCKESR